MTDKKVGLALGGGGVRGFCHVGVLKVLQKAGIKIDAIAGTSMGAVVGGVFSSGASLDDMENISNRFTTFKIADFNAFNIMRESIFKGERVRRYISKHLKEKEIQNFPVEFCAVSFDLNSGESVHFRQGDACDAIYASMAVPGVFKPLSKDNMLLVDGGLKENLPTKALREMGCEIIICVDPIGKYDGDKFPKKMLATLMNSFNVQTRTLYETTGIDADLVITPNLSGIANYQFKPNKTKRAINAGIRSTKEKLDDIIKLLK